MCMLMKMILQRLKNVSTGNKGKIAKMKFLNKQGTIPSTTQLEELAFNMRVESLSNITEEME